MKEKNVTGQPKEPMQGVVEVPPDLHDKFFGNRVWFMGAQHIVDAQTGKAKFLVRAGDETHLVDEIVIGNVTYRAVNYEVAFVTGE